MVKFSHGEQMRNQSFRHFRGNKAERILCVAHEDGENVWVHIDQLIELLLPAISATAGPHIRIRFEIEPGLPGIDVDLRHLELAILNLVVNAREVMPEGGVLTIGARLVRSCSPVGPGSYLQLETIAHATGLSATVRNAGEAKGLGLWLAGNLARLLGGDLAVFRASGFATSVQLWLPVAD
jgi:signal transduction histidine kinase